MNKAILILTILITFPASALESFVGKVTLVEPTYLPNSISFYMDTGTSTCPGGSWLRWTKTEENNKIVYSTLMTALITGNKVRLHFNDGDTTCQVQYLHLLAN